MSHPLFGNKRAVYQELVDQISTTSKESDELYIKICRLKELKEGMKTSELPILTTIFAPKSNKHEGKYDLMLWYYLPELGITVVDKIEGIPLETSDDYKAVAKYLRPNTLDLTDCKKLHKKSSSTASEELELQFTIDKILSSGRVKTWSGLKQALQHYYYPKK
jgi:hypothetical protein